jgi:recombinational DNA repair protein (RecF pathway)
MSVLTSEAVILRTWPVHESDLLVSFFTRDYGRLKGMAKAALKSRKRFGGALEPMTLTRAWFAERPRQELVRLDQLEILRSPLSAPVDQTRMAVLSFYAEVIDEALPERDPQATVFRLVASVLEQTNAVRAEAGNGAGQAGIGAGPICWARARRAVDGADVFFAMDDAADGIVAGHWPLHGVRGDAGRR